MTREQVKTVVIFFAALFAIPVVCIAILLGWEFKTLADQIPENHITASIRAALKGEPWAVVGLLIGWVLLIAAPFALLLGHLGSPGL